MRVENDYGDEEAEGAPDEVEGPMEEGDTRTYESKHSFDPALLWAVLQRFYDETGVWQLYAFILWPRGGAFKAQIGEWGGC